MLADEIKTGESANTEFKVEVPKKSEKYIKSVVRKSVPPTPSSRL